MHPQWIAQITGPPYFTKVNPFKFLASPLRYSETIAVENLTLHKKHEKDLVNC